MTSVWKEGSWKAEKTLELRLKKKVADATVVVGLGFGFVVESRSSGRVIVTATCNLSGDEDGKIYLDLVGPLGLEPCIAAKCRVHGDLAVLTRVGDDKAFAALVDCAAVLPVADKFEKGTGYMLTRGWRRDYLSPYIVKVESPNTVTICPYGNGSRALPNPPEVRWHASGLSGAPIVMLNRRVRLDGHDPPQGAAIAVYAYSGDAYYPHPRLLKKHLDF